MNTEFVMAIEELIRKLTDLKSLSPKPSKDEEDKFKYFLKKSRAEPEEFSVRCILHGVLKRPRLKCSVLGGTKLHKNKRFQMEHYSTGYNAMQGAAVKHQQLQ